MVLDVNRQGAREPKYYQVKRHLLQLIDTLVPGSLMPTERVLTVELETSRTTVRQALSELVGEGRLVRRQGSGTYVAEPKITWPLHMTSFTEQAAAAGYSASTQLLDAVRERATEDIAERLSIQPAAAMEPASKATASASCRGSVAPTTSRTSSEAPRRTPCWVMRCAVPASTAASRAACRARRTRPLGSPPA